MLGTDPCGICREVPVRLRLDVRCSGRPGHGGSPGRPKKAGLRGGNQAQDSAVPVIDQVKLSGTVAAKGTHDKVVLQYESPLPVALSILPQPPYITARKITGLSSHI